MQAIAPVTEAQLLAAGQEPKAKFEIYVDAAWVNLNDLGGKNYVEDFSISLGGASMTPHPVAGKWDVTLSNEDGIFHPKHPDSPYKDYLKTGRRIRISVGAEYAGVAYYWQRIIGFMDEPRFSMPDYKVNISGGDYMKFLQDTEFGNLDNYWGTFVTFDSIASDGTSGSELYNEVDAMDINNEADNVTNWIPSDCTFVSFAEEGGGSTYVGKITTAASGDCDVGNQNIFTPTVGKQYRFQFKYKRVSGLWANILVYQGGYELSRLTRLEESVWTTVKLYFTAQTTDPIQIEIYYQDLPGVAVCYFDQFSINGFIPYWDRYYELPGGAKGPYRVILDGVDVWQGETDEGWYYEEDTRRVSFDHNKTVANGTDNLVIHYFTAESPENVVADILVKCGLYVDRAAALAAMEYVATGITIDRNWFKVESTRLDAIRKICERCDYRFHFKYDGDAVFKPKSAPEFISFTFTDQKHIASVRNYPSRNEIRNRIIIEGHKQAQPVNREETLPSELRGEAHDQDSIDEYGERTLTIKNHLFQDQASIDAMCTSLLAEYKDPKWYPDVEVPFNFAPLEMGDKISFKERLSPTLEITQTGVIRDIKIDSFNTTYKCVAD